MILSSRIAVFGPSLQVLAMIIYGLELVLWMGIFACGGYYNLRPWWKRRSENRGQASNTEPGEQAHGTGVSVRPSTSSAQEAQYLSIALQRLPSSTSVFSALSVDTAVRRAPANAQSHAIPV